MDYVIQRDAALRCYVVTIRLRVTDKELRENKDFYISVDRNGVVWGIENVKGLKC